MIRKTATILFALLIAAGGAGAQTLNKANSLKGLSGLRIWVINDHGGFEVLDGNAIRTETELRMFQAGIQVLMPAASLHRAEGLPRFVIQIGRAIVFSLIEPATLARDSTPVGAVTWSQTVTNCAGNHTRQIVCDTVSKFLNQWLRDNPVPSP
jgi:hypothetical protein